MNEGRKSTFELRHSVCAVSGSAGLRCAETVEKGKTMPPLPASATDLALSRLDKFRNAHGETPTSTLRGRMQRVMQKNCAVFRDGPLLKEGVAKIDAIWNDSADIKVTDRSLIWNSDLVEAMEYDNLISQAAVTVIGAENRKESRGAHARDDFPKRDDANWMVHTLAFADDATRKVTLDTRPVHTKTMTNEVKYIEPKARVY